VLNAFVSDTQSVWEDDRRPSGGEAFREKSSCPFVFIRGSRKFSRYIYEFVVLRGWNMEEMASG